MSIPGLKSHILSSLRGLRKIPPNINPLSTTALTSTIFKFCVPAAILAALFDHHSAATTHDQQVIALKTIKSAFLTPEYDRQTLSWLTCTYIESHRLSNSSILDIAETLLHTLQPSIYFCLLHRYVDLWLCIPISIPRKYTLGPVENVLEEVIAKCTHPPQVCIILSILLSTKTYVFEGTCRVFKSSRNDFRAASKTSHEH